jgi:hypothetical protein
MTIDGFALHILYLQSHPRAVVKPRRARIKVCRNAQVISEDCLCEETNTFNSLQLAAPFRVLPRLPTLFRIRFDAPSQKKPRFLRTQGHRFPEYLSIITMMKSTSHSQFKCFAKIDGWPVTVEALFSSSTCGFYDTQRSM